MSRVQNGQKYINENKYPSNITNPSKTVRTVGGNGARLENAKTLTSWLFLQYGMSYKAYRRKSLEKA